jgi:hypothetical protein
MDAVNNEIPIGILAEDCDATEGAKACMVEPLGLMEPNPPEMAPVVEEPKPSSTRTPLTAEQRARLLADMKAVQEKRAKRLRKAERFIRRTGVVGEIALFNGKTVRSSDLPPGKMLVDPEHGSILVHCACGHFMARRLATMGDTIECAVCGRKVKAPEPPAKSAPIAEEPKP